MSTLTRAIAIVVVSITEGLSAQGQAPQPPSPRPPAASAARIITIGCISREQGARLVLTDRRNDPPTTYRLDGDQAALALHVGHTVEIAGALSSPAGAGRGSARALKVQSLTWISTNCQQITAAK